MWWIACLGGLIGMAVAFCFVADRNVVADQRRRAADLRVVAEPDHHLRVDDARGDLATTVTLIVTAFLPGKGRTLYDPEVTDGKISFGVENPPEVRSHINRAWATLAQARP